MTLIVENDLGERMELTRNHNFDVLEVLGLNPPNAAINTFAISGMDGTKFNSARVEQRNIVILLNVHHPIESNRLLLYRFFRVKKMLRLYIKTETRDVYIDGYVESFENSAFTDLQKPQISIVCPQPFFLAAADTEIRFSDSVALFEFPFSIPQEGIEFSRKSQISNSLLNAGEIAIGGTIILRAMNDGIVNPVFYNLSTQEYFGINITMQSGDVITICTEVGKKSATLLRGGTATNILSNRKDGSTWVQFEAGENRLSIDADEGNGDIDATLIVRQKFEGV